MSRLNKSGKVDNIEIPNTAENKLCPVCGAVSLPMPYYRTHDWLVLRCSRCTLAWVVDLAKVPESTSFGWGEDVVQESQKRFRMYQDRLGRVERHVPFPRAWLDVGCGGGGMLKCVADVGFVAEGIEPSPAADHIIAQFGIPVHKKILSEAIGDLGLEEYGVISYFHVLEHVQNPTVELMAARQLLGDKGLLVIEVPFFDSLLWKLWRSRHRHFYRAHRFYFNGQSMSALLQSTGFTMIECESVPYQMTMDWMLMRLGRATDLLRHCLPRSILDRSIQINTGEYLLVIARKA
jgi:SAM-dependent methyltransferase